jgi:hypothetical protein
MHSSNLPALFLDIEIFVVPNGDPPCTPGTCAAVLWRFRQLYLKNCWMTPGLFSTPTYDPTVNFPLNFLNFHSDALICHYLFLHFILIHSFAICYFWANHLSRPPLPPHGAARIISIELILYDLLVGDPENISPNNLPNCAHLSYLTPTPTNMQRRGDNSPLTIAHSHSTQHQPQSLYIHKSLITMLCTAPHHCIKLASYIKQALWRIWSLWKWVSSVCRMRFNLS